MPVGPARDRRRLSSRSSRKSIETPLPDTSRNTNRENDAQLNALDEMGFTLLHKAIITRQYKTSRHLLTRALDVNQPMPNGMTPLLLACRHGDIRSVEILLTSSSLDMNCCDKLGWSALHHCALNNHQELAEMLIIAGADPWMMDHGGDYPLKMAPTKDMMRVLRNAMDNYTTIMREMILKSFIVLKKGKQISEPTLGLELEVPKFALGKDIFFMCKKSPASCNQISLGQSEIVLSDVYEFWPSDISFLLPANLQLQCAPANEGEEVILRINGTIEVPLYKEKAPIIYRAAKSSRKAAPVKTCSSHNDAIRKFAIPCLGTMYVVARLPKETFNIPLLGATARHSQNSSLSVTVPKNGFNTEATVSLQVCPVATDITNQLQRQYPHILGLGPICEVSHTDSEVLTRRLVTMTVPTPEDSRSEGKLVVISGQAGENDRVEPVDKCTLVEGGDSAEFLTRSLTWKVAVLVKTNSRSPLDEVCRMVRRYTGRRMRIVTCLLMYKTDIILKKLDILFEIIPVDTPSKSDSPSHKQQDYQLARFTKKASSIMLCEGESMTLNLPEVDQSLCIAFFSKQKSSREISFDLPSSQFVHFNITSQDSKVSIYEGEICA